MGHRGSQVEPERVTQRRLPLLPPFQLLELGNLQLADLRHLDLIGREVMSHVAAKSQGVNYD